jgi:hypothetical protein
MQSIAYLIDSRPRLTWPAVTELTDEDGNPTGETVDNLEQLIANLPKGTDYTRIDGDVEANAWWAAHQPPKSPADRRAEIMAELAALDLASIRPLRAIDNGTDTTADHQKLIDLEARAAALRAELGGLDD